MNKFYELCGSNESEAARRLGVKSALFHRWRTGENVPTPLSRPTIAQTLGISVDELMHGDAAVKEDPARYGPKLSRTGQRAVERFDALIKSGDEEITKHIERQIDLWWDLYEGRTKQRKDRD